ncbi:MAG: hypothetical protein O7G85_17100 [Planctomycetota bacterium]|nr:hypothetical protein [Planctomycetota bacterium]
MKFQLLDEIIEQSSDRIVAIKQVSLAEEYLADHFPTFPVLPGVLMIETMIQAARRMLTPRGNARLVLGEVKALKFGSMVRPGEILHVEVKLQKELGEDCYVCKGTGTVIRDHVKKSGSDDPSTAGSETAVSGRFTMRPIRIN